MLLITPQERRRLERQQELEADLQNASDLLGSAAIEGESWPLSSESVAVLNKRADDSCFPRLASPAVSLCRRVPRQVARVAPHDALQDQAGL